MSIGACDALDHVTTAPVAGSLTFNQIAKYISAGCCGATILTISALLLLHGSNYVRRPEQKHIVLIFLLPTSYAVCSIIGLISYRASPYLENIPRFFEAVAICSLFELFVAYAGVAPTLTPLYDWAVTGVALEQDAYAAADPSQNYDQRTYEQAPKPIGYCEAQPVAVAPEYVLDLKRVYQLPLVEIAAFVTDIILNAAACPSSKTYQRVTIVLNAVRAVSTVIAVINVLRFFRPLAAILKPRGALSKILCVKIPVGIMVLQSLVLNIIFQRSSVANATAHMSWLDWHRGVLDLMLSVESTFMAFLYVYGFWPGFYIREAKKSGGHVRIVAVVVDSVNLPGIVGRVIKGVTRDE